VENATFVRSDTSDGNVYPMKPSRIRWDYLDRNGNVKKTIMSNGKVVYIVDRDNKQVTKKDFANALMPVAVSFLYGKGDLKAAFRVELDAKSKYGDPEEDQKGAPDIVLKLTPKQPSAQYKTLYLVVAPDNFRVKRSVIIDSSNNLNQFRFYSPDFEKSISGSWFELDQRSVKDYRIVDADQASSPTVTPRP
jgi:outer membrane lipoprotein-sorting protein